MAFERGLPQTRTQEKEFRHTIIHTGRCQFKWPEEKEGQVSREEGNPPEKRPKTRVVGRGNREPRTRKVGNWGVDRSSRLRAKSLKGCITEKKRRIQGPRHGAKKDNCQVNPEDGRKRRKKPPSRTRERNGGGAIKKPIKREKKKKKR